MFRAHGWRKSLYLDPRYRQSSQIYDFDGYSSKGSAVHPLKKYNQLRMAIEGAENPNPPVEGEYYFNSILCQCFHFFRCLQYSAVIAGEGWKKREKTGTWVRNG